MQDSEWVEKFSKTHNRTYFYNKRTKKTSWEDPLKPSLIIQPVEQKRVSLFDFLIQCLRHEVTLEYDWERRYDVNFQPELFEFSFASENENIKKPSFSFYWISKVPYVYKETDYESGCVAIISLMDEHTSMFERVQTDKDLCNKLCGFRPFYEFNLSCFAAFLGVLTPPTHPFRAFMWKEVYKPQYEKFTQWDSSAETWESISRVRISLCTPFKSWASTSFVNEITLFLHNVLSQSSHGATTA